MSTEHDSQCTLCCKTEHRLEHNTSPPVYSLTAWTENPVMADSKWIYVATSCWFQSWIPTTLAKCTYVQCGTVPQWISMETMGSQNTETQESIHRLGSLWTSNDREIEFCDTVGSQNTDAVSGFNWTNPRLVSFVSKQKFYSSRYKFRIRIGDNFSFIDRKY